VKYAHEKLIENKEQLSYLKNRGSFLGEGRR
jgi:hypothetical protein